MHLFRKDEKMYSPFTFSLPTRIEFGNGKLEMVGKIVKEFEGKRVLIVTDKGVMETSIYDRVLAALSKEGIDNITFDKVRPNPRDLDANEGGEFARSEGVDIVIGLGGGSSVDMAKAVAGMCTNEGDIHAIMKPNKLTYDPVPVIAIPTTAGTGSEVTSFSVLTIEEENRKSSIFDEKARPTVAINDPTVLENIPPHIAAATGMDALTHAIEAYTCKYATSVTDALAMQAIRLISENICAMVHDRTEESSWNMMMGSLLAGIAFGYSDIAGVHCMAEALGGLYDTPHGVANSIFLPIVFKYNIPANIKKHADVGLGMRLDATGKSDREVAQAAADALRQMATDVGIPSLRELGYVREEDFDLLADLALKNVSLPSNPRKLNKEDFMALYREAY